MRWRRLSPRVAITLPLSVAVVAARMAGLDVMAGAMAAATIAALAVPLRGAAMIAGAALVAGMAAAAWASQPGVAAALLASLPLAGNLLLAWHFGATLRQGQEPLISRYTRFDFGRMPTEFVGYGRALTALWTAVFLGFAALYAVALVPGSVPPVMAVAVNAVLAAVLFLGEHAVRNLRFPQFGLAHPARTLRAIWRADAARRRHDRRLSPDLPHRQRGAVSP